MPSGWQQTDLFPSTSSPQASRARTSPSPARARGWPEPAPGSCSMFYVSWETLRHDGSFWKTLRLSEGEASVDSFVSSMRSGTMLNGTLCRHRPLALRTSVTAGGSSLVVPTPTAADGRGSGSRNTHPSRAHTGLSLTDWINGDRGTGRTTRLPTPTASAWRSGHASERTLQRNSRPLQEVVIGGARPSRDPASSRRYLNPTWVEWLMGFPLGWTGFHGALGHAPPRQSSSAGDASP